MTCRQSRRLLSRHLEGQLDPAAVERVRAHLDGCDICRATHALLAQPARALAASNAGNQTATPPPDLAERALRAAFAAEEPTHAPSFLDRWIPIAWPTAVAATVVTAVLLALALRAPQPAATPTSSDPVIQLAPADGTDDSLASLLALEAP